MMGGSLFKYLKKDQMQKQDEQTDKKRRISKKYKIVANNTSFFNEHQQCKYTQISDGEKAVLRYFVLQHHSNVEYLD